jgi:dimeric dUTPase (all-alpha-NTP-PPase superfamily)
MMTNKLKQIEMIETMFNMQMALDDAIYKEHNTSHNRDKTKLALFDELGELTHELKSTWCWWKKTVKPVDNSKVLEELVDCWHFGMSLDYHFENLEGLLLRIETFLDGANPNMYARSISPKTSYYVTAPMQTHLVTMELIKLTFHLGFSIEDVYWMYLTKNAENYERLRTGY